MKIINQSGDVNFCSMWKIDNVERVFGERIMNQIENAASTIREIWGYQHPVMHTWFVLSSLSLCFMFAFLFFAI